MHKKGINRGLILENIFIILIVSSACFLLLSVLTNQYQTLREEIYKTQGLFLAKERIEHLIRGPYSELTDEAKTGITGFNGFSIEVIVKQVDNNDFSQEVSWNSSDYRKIWVYVYHTKIRTIELCTVRANY